MFDVMLIFILVAIALTLVSISGSLRLFLTTPIQVTTAPGEPEVVTLWSNPSPGEQVIVRDATSDEYVLCEIVHVVENPDKSFTWDVTAVEPR